MDPSQPKSARWTRTYPPLALIVVAILTAAFILPSSLNLPQSNPSTVLEYAPVPPEDDEPPPPADGNASALGLGSSESLTTPAATPPPPPPPPPPGSGGVARDKNCVGDQQSVDPNSPPCVAFFEGDNFGATYQGVTRNEIVVLIYLDKGAPNNEVSLDDDGNYVDIDSPPRPACPKSWPARSPYACDDLWIRIARAFSKYFNATFQTYKRRVHYIAYYTNASSRAERVADAAKNWSEKKPFAVIDAAFANGFNEAYDDAMASRGVMVFTQESAAPNEFFARNSPRLWAFWPDIEHWAEQYVNYVCTNIAGGTVRWSGNPQGTGEYQGRPRKFGVFHTTDAGQPGLQLFAKKVKDGIAGCGITDPVVGTFAREGFIVDNSDDGQAQLDAVQKFKDQDVTTVLWLGGLESKFTGYADRLAYYPELVLAGDLQIDANTTGRLQNRNVFQNAWGTSFQLRFPRPEENPAYQAYKHGNPEGVEEEARLVNDAYRDHFMLFTAIQVAGPRLNPFSVDKGFHAIPPKASNDPFTASFFFDLNDYTGVKDAMVQWWDPSGREPGVPENGCWRVVNGGRRHLADSWPSPDQQQPFVNGTNDPCTVHEAGRPLRPT